MIENLFIKQYRVSLEFREDFQFQFFHGGVLYSLISSALRKHPIGKDVVLFPVESGHINYKKGDKYNFGIASLSPSLFTIEELKKGIKRVSDEVQSGPFINGKFILIGLKEINIPAYEKKQLIFNNEIKLRFLTPLRMLRSVPDGKEKYFNPFLFEPKRFFRLLYNRIYDIGKNNSKEKPEYFLPPLPELELVKKTLLWVDLHLEKENLGGVIGVVKLKGEMGEIWKRILYYGQFVHAGNNAAFGFGKYLINGYEENIFNIKPAETFLKKSLSLQNMNDAFKVLKSKKSGPGTDGVTLDNFEKKYTTEINKIIKEVKNNDYKPKPLKGFIIKKETKEREIAVASIRDKLLQRAVQQIISPSIDRLLEENSYAFRKGISRHKVASDLQKLYKEGYRYVFKSDIDSFFDMVDWEILNDKLDVLFYNDPIKIILKLWIEQPVVLNKKIIIRDKGLPQGSAVSPLLANLFLDEFDESLQNEFVLLRYADDFVILSRSREAITRAKEKVRFSLEKLKLNIKPSKTIETSFEEGFSYLGFLIQNSTVIEKKKNVKESDIIDDETAKIFVSNNWSANIDSENGQEISEIIEPKVKMLHPSAVSSLDFPLYITSNTANLYLDKDEIVVEEEGEVKRFPITRILSVIFLGNSKITFPAIRKLTLKEIPLFFCYPSGKLYLAIPWLQFNYKLWLKQYELNEKENFRINFAKEVIKSKIRNSRINAKRFGCEEVIENKLSQLENMVDKCETIGEISGYEGKAAAIYFSFIKNNIPELWNFNKRIKHPPPDPMNLLLSLGYSILHKHFILSLLSAEVNPEIGIIHSEKKWAYPLASDLMEPFRYLVESSVLQIVHRHIVTYDDFIIEPESKQPCILKREALKRVISTIEKKLNEEKFESGKENISYRTLILSQGEKIKESILTGEMIYKPYLLK